MEFTALLRALAAAVEAKDFDAFVACFTEDGIYDDYFLGRKQGTAGLKEMLAHFYQGGDKFRWEFYDPLSDGKLAYARYRFSYDSLQPQALGKRIGFEGISCLKLRDGRICHYSEVFDRGTGLAQQNFPPERIVRNGLKHAAAWRSDPAWAAHFAKG